MKRKTVIWLITIIVVCSSLLAGVAYWQWNNITAFRYALQYTPEEQQEIVKKADNEILARISEEYSQVELSRLPEEGVQMLTKGEMAEEVAVAVLTGEITWEEAKEQPMTLPQASQTPQIPQSDKVQDILAQIYVLRSGYVGQLEGLIPQGWKEYVSKKATKSEIISKYLGIGSSLEGECDARMEGLLSELQAELKRTGGDLSLISQIRSAYQTEKSVKKAELIEKYLK